MRNVLIASLLSFACASASAQMADAWVDMDRDGFVDGLATAVARLAVIHADECQ